MSTTGRSSKPAFLTEDSVDVRRYLAAVRRSRGLIFAIAVLVTGAVVGISLALPKTYKATTTLVLDPTSTGLDASDAASQERQLATTEALLTSPRVLGAAAKRVSGESVSSLSTKVESRSDPNASQANIIEITARDEIPRHAADVANAVAEGFLTERTALERARIARAREQLQAQIDQLQTRQGSAAEIGAIQQRLSQLTITEGSAGADLQVAGRAEVPSTADSPRPLRNGILALFGSIFLGVLVALARDQLSPRITDPRDLARLLETRVVAGIPYVPGHPRRRRAGLLTGAEAEAYETLRSSFELLVPPGERSVVLFTGAVHGEGKTTVVARLGGALARAGHRVLLVSADLRIPNLHNVFGLELGTGLSDLLRVGEWEGDLSQNGVMSAAIEPVLDARGGKHHHGVLHVVTSGSPVGDPGRLLAGPGADLVFEQLRHLDYDYVLLDAPPLLGIADSHVLARHADHLLLVSRLDRLNYEQVSDLADSLYNMDRSPLGIVMIGARSEFSPYYLARRGPLVADPEPRTSA